MASRVSPPDLSEDAAEKSAQEQIDELDRLARLLDSHWRVPGTSFRFGVDAVAGLIPGIGDAATGLVSAYLIYRASRFDVPRSVLAVMIGNILLDTTIGAIPLAGSVFDVLFKANNRNIRHLRRHLERKAQRNGT